MKYTPLVSIVIPAYNASNYLSEAIDSALSQTYKNIEIIVVNDGSDDNGATERIALSYGDKVRYFCKTNGGSSSALNYGIKNMRGEWFSWLSHDDLYSPYKVERQINFLKSMVCNGNRIENVVLFSACDIINEKGNYLRKSNFKKKLELSRLVSILDNKSFIAEPTKFMFHGCSCLINKSVFYKIGMFDEKLKYTNDVDMWFRIYSNNFIIRMLPDALVKGRVHKMQVSTSIGYSYHNIEQDRFWNMLLKWLIENCDTKTDYKNLYKFGVNAILKTRYKEGNVALNIISDKYPVKIFIIKYLLIIYSKIWEVFKRLYLRFLV